MAEVGRSGGKEVNDLPGPTPSGRPPSPLQRITTLHGAVPPVDAPGRQTQSRAHPPPPIRPNTHAGSEAEQLIGEAADHSDKISVKTHPNRQRPAQILHRLRLPSRDPP
jgi:hypothetical protein